MTIVTCTRTLLGKWTLKFQYDPDLIDLIKQVIPTRARSYDPDTRQWTISDDHHLKTLENSAFLEGDYQFIRIDPRDKAKERTDAKRAVPSPALTLEKAFVQLFNLLPIDDRKAVRRALVGALHPDRGGSHEAMVALNQALAAVAA